MINIWYFYRITHLTLHVHVLKINILFPTKKRVVELTYYATFQYSVRRRVTIALIGQVKICQILYGEDQIFGDSL